jgi:hypothetical protein
VTLEHRAAMTDDGIRCSCGADGCIVTVDGVWTPSRRVDPAEWAEAFETFTAPALGAWVESALRDHRGHGGAIVAEHDADESLYWRLSPAVLSS